MNTFSRVAIAMVGMTGLAAAQPKAGDAKMAPKMADAKAPASGMPEMKPPPELAELAKSASGTWKCKGQGMDHTMKLVDMTGTMKSKLELDNYWLHSSFESSMGKEPFHFESYTSYDAQTKKWKRVMVESGGGWSAGESAGIKDGKLDWDLAMHTMMGDGMFRDHEDVSDPKAGAKMMGEFSMDKGKTWMKVYEMTCKK
jgi:hypothetical protein